MTIVCHSYLKKCDLNVSKYVQYVQFMNRYMSKHTRMMQKHDIRIGKIHALENYKSTLFSKSVNL